eukprot:23507-Eustigmatos_ZCMA.PRE.1
MKAASLGYRRVVLARELTAKEVKDIRYAPVSIARSHESCHRSQGVRDRSSCDPCCTGRRRHPTWCSWRRLFMAACATPTQACAFSAGQTTRVRAIGASVHTPVVS